MRQRRMRRATAAVRSLAGRLLLSCSRPEWHPAGAAAGQGCSQARPAAIVHLDGGFLAPGSGKAAASSRHTARRGCCAGQGGWVASEPHPSCCDSKPWTLACCWSSHSINASVLGAWHACTRCARYCARQSGARPVILSSGQCASSWVRSS
eukprot:351181-Chlamydomonas_euryale.AAC.1